MARPKTTAQNYRGNNPNTTCLTAWIFIWFCTLFASPAPAQEPVCYYPLCDDSCFTDDLYVEIDFLYWKRCNEHLQISACVDGGGRDYQVDFTYLAEDWIPGARLIVEKPCFYRLWGFSASYVYLSNEESWSKQSETIVCNIGPIDPVPGQHLKADFYQLYQEWELMWDYPFRSPSYGFFKPFFGIAGLYLKQDLDWTLLGNSEPSAYDWDARYLGFGLRAGAAYETSPFYCLRIYSRIEGTILGGHADSSFHHPGPIVYKFKEDGLSRSVSGYHLSLGILYEAKLCDVQCSIRLGYEFQNWFDLPAPRTFTSYSNEDGLFPAAVPRSTFLGFHGLNVGLGMTF